MTLCNRAVFDLIKVAVSHIIREDGASLEKVLAVADHCELEEMRIVQGSLFTIFSTETKRSNIAKAIGVIEALTSVIEGKLSSLQISPAPRKSFLTIAGYDSSELVELMRKKMNSLRENEPEVRQFAVN